MTHKNMFVPSVKSLSSSINLNFNKRPAIIDPTKKYVIIITIKDKNDIYYIFNLLGTTGWFNQCSFVVT